MAKDDTLGTQCTLCPNSGSKIERRKQTFSAPPDFLNIAVANFFCRTPMLMLLVIWWPNGWFKKSFDA